MIEIEIDGQKVEVPAGSMVMDAAVKLGLYVPHFCYHKKLSIAANCRMCLVEVEKAPKPLPACATPVSSGMKVSVTSDKARMAQKGVMEFLLINHPLDCPICDQGGECQLQDLAVGYGPSASQYSEGKRVVFHKPMGPLISAEEMSRCIHCTRCVRFGQEIAGVMELGMAGRGEHSEIMSFVGQAIESELSGNMIDVCPVGALTSKPFRYQARTWELSRRRTVSPHDALGANLVAQSKNQQILRVVPQENEPVNECWISDRDRFAYEGLQSKDRITEPLVRDPNGQWRTTSWEEALAKAADLLRTAAAKGADRVRAMGSPLASLEELSLMARLARGLKSDALDFRIGLTDPRFDQARQGVPSLNGSLSDLSSLERVLLVGASLRSQLPLVAQRLRQAARGGAAVHTLHGYAEPLLMATASQEALAPSLWLTRILGMVQAAAQASGQPLPSTVAQACAQVQPSPLDQQRVESLRSASVPAKARILVGADLLSHADASLLLTALQALSDLTGVPMGLLPEGGNGLGGYLAGAVPSAGGRNAATLFADDAAAFLLVQLEPALDLANGPAAVATLKSARQHFGVVALSAYRSAVDEFANVILPVVPYTETSGSYVNLEGRLQTVQAVVSPKGSARPAWKVLRVLGNLLDLQGFEAESSEAVRQSVLGELADQALVDLPAARFQTPLPALAPESVSSSASVTSQATVTSGSQGLSLSLSRLGPPGVYASDPIVRRAAALSATRQSKQVKAALNPQDLAAIGAAPGLPGLITAEGETLQVELIADARVASGVVLLTTGHPSLAGLNQRQGSVSLRLAQAALVA